MCAAPARPETESPARTRACDTDDGTVFGRKRREERRFDREATRYQMRQRMLSIGDDYEQVDWDLVDARAVERVEPDVEQSCPPMTTMHFGVVSVIGRSRLPTPAASRKAFTLRPS